MEIVTNSGGVDVRDMSGHGPLARVRQAGLALPPAHDATVGAQPAAPPLLARERAAVGAPAGVHEGMKVIDRRGIESVVAELRAKGQRV